MRWEDLRQSINIEDDREASASRGGGFGIPGGGGGLGIGMVIILGLIGWALGIDPSVLIGGAQILTGGGQATQQTSPAPEVDTGTPNDQTGRFVAAVLGSDWDTQDGHYRVRIYGQWFVVPDDAVVAEPNRFGPTVVWPYRDRDGTTQIRCFMPGAGT